MMPVSVDALKDSQRMISRNPWRYGKNIRDRDYLNKNQSFDELVEDLCVALANAEHSSIRFQMEPSGRNYSGDDPLLKKLKCRRPSWHISMERTLLDKFYNGQMGIRAQYYKSPYNGRSMTRRLLARLQDHLVQLAQAKDTTVDASFLALSLSGSSAKVWISEKDLNGRKIIRASDLTLVEDEIQNDWLDLARMVKNGEFGLEDYQLYSAAINGVRAPIPDQLEVKGAWITGTDWREYVTPDKRDRDCQLFMFGFT